MNKHRVDLNNPYEFKCIRKDHNCTICMPNFKVNEDGQRIAEELEKLDPTKVEHHLFCPRKFINSPVHKDIVNFLEMKRKSEEESRKIKRIFKLKERGNK